MKVLVTGGAGFIGSCLIWKLNEGGIKDIIVTDIAKSAESCVNLAGKAFRDYMDRDELLGYIKQDKLKDDVDTIIHLGACTDTTETDVAYLQKNNYFYSRELAQWSSRNGKRFLYASSAATYGAGELGYNDDDELTPKLKPLNEYGVSKQLSSTSGSLRTACRRSLWGLNSSMYTAQTSTIRARCGVW